MQEESFIFSTRASCGREKSGISPTIQEGISGNRNFQLEEVPTGLSKGKGSFLLVISSSWAIKMAFLGSYSRVSHA